MPARDLGEQVHRRFKLVEIVDYKEFNYSGITTSAFRQAADCKSPNLIFLDRVRCQELRFVASERTSPTEKLIFAVCKLVVSIDLGGDKVERAYKVGKLEQHVSMRLNTCCKLYFTANVLK